MSANFQFSKLSIRGFRGIHDLDLDLPLGKPLHLIGGNNSGKSTALRAVALALGGGGFHQFIPDAFDYFHYSTGKAVAEFTVTMHLTADDLTHLPAVQGVGPPVPVHAIQVRGTTDKRGRFNHRRWLLDAAGEAIKVSPRTALKGETKEAYKGRANLGWSQPYVRLDEIRKDMPDIWLLTPQNLHRSLYEWKTGPLQRLSRMLAQRFLETEWEFPYQGRVRKMPDTIVTAHAFFREAVDAFPFWQNDLKPKLQDTLSRYVGTKARFALRPDVQQINDWLAQQLAVSFATDVGGATTPLQSMGDGWQSLVRLAALDVISQYPDQVADRVILLTEEPETHLHPHLRRKMRTVLERLAGQGWIVISATHGPEFISFTSPQVVVKLWRKGDDVAKGVFDTSAVTAAMKFQEKLDERGNHEMLFAHRVVLCEGKDDCWAIRSCLGKLDPSLDLDTSSVSLVDTGGVQNLPDYADIAKKLGIPWCAVSDEDKKLGGSVNPNTEATRKKVEAARGADDMSTIWPGSLEACLGASAPQKAKPEWQATNIDPKPLAQMEREHSDFVAACTSVHKWITA